MKYLITSVFILILAACENCPEDKITENKPPQPTCFYQEIEYDYKKDGAPNCIDKGGLRQNHWCIYGNDDPAKGYPSEGKIEEGVYKDGVKHKQWNYYKKNGKDIDSIVIYNMGTIVSVEKIDTAATN